MSPRRSRRTRKTRSAQGEPSALKEPEAQDEPVADEEPDADEGLDDELDLDEDPDADEEPDDEAPDADEEFGDELDLDEEDEDLDADTDLAEETGVRIEQVGAGIHTWIVGDDDEVIVIDPGEDADAVLSAVGEREVAAVICTNGHASHVAAAIEVAARDEAPVALHPADRNLWREKHPDDAADIDMEDGGIFEIAGVSLEVIHAAGYTRGSVCLYSEDLDAVFTGDVLCGSGAVPYDGEFPDFPRQLSSIGEHLLTLPGRTRVLPGQGDELTIADANKRFDGWVSRGPVLPSPDSEEEKEEAAPKRKEAVTKRKKA